MQKEHIQHPQTEHQKTVAQYYLQMVSALASHQEVVTEFYQQQYDKRMEHDSPDKSRTEMALDLLNLYKSGAFPNDMILDIGSGPRAVERELKSYAKCQQIKPPQLFSIDRSVVSKSLLLDNKSEPQSKHSVSNALTLPFADGTFGAVFSNHALDFIPRAAQHFYQPYQEAVRVLAEGGYLILHCHHPTMLRSTSMSSASDEETRSHWGYLQRNSILLSHEQEIEIMIAKLGLITQTVECRSDSNDKWWRIVAQKS